MKLTSPIFVCNNDTFAADTCWPLVQAADEGKVTMNAIAHGSYPGFHLEKDTLAGLSSIGHWDTATQQQWGLPWHRNEGFEICLLETGKLDFAIEKEDNRYLLKPGDITISHPWQKHRLGNPHIGPSRLHWIIFDVNVRRPNQQWQWPDWIILSKADIEELTDFLRYCELPVWHSTRQIRDCFGEISQIVSSDDPCSYISMLTVMINELFILLLEQFRLHRPQLQRYISGSQKTVELFIDDLQTNLNAAAYLWTVDEMASQCGLGKTQFRSYFKQLTNMQPADYLTKCRINWATRLMAEDRSVSIKLLGSKCGFNSSQYFSNTFKKVKGVSPKQYLANLWSKGA